jgi:hypothetical protein
VPGRLTQVPYRLGEVLVSGAPIRLLERLRHRALRLFKLVE